jgi:hypothetical protein
MSLRADLEKVRIDYGTLTPANVVDAARSVNHPLHDRFEWDDSVAGEKYRRVQARALIRTVRCSFVSPTNGPTSLRVFHSVPGTSTPVYEALDDITTDPVAQAVLVAQMYRDWATFKARYEHLKEFVALIAPASSNP